MRTKTILLVEDEPIISADVQDRLEAMGYRVSLASHGFEALAICADSKGAFDLVLINFKQKTIADGMVLAGLLRKIQPAPIAFITGWRVQDIQTSKAYNTQYSILYKPFTLRQLQDFINDSRAPTEGGRIGL